MFKIVLHAMWSRDFMTPLLRNMAELLDTNLEQVKGVIQAVTQGQHPAVYTDRIAVAHELMECILQFGVFASIEQSGPITEAGIIAEFKELMVEDFSGWMVLLDEREEHVVKIIDSGSLAGISFESQTLMDALGEMALERGAARMDARTRSQVEHTTRVWRTLYEQRVRFYLDRKRRRRH